MSFLTTNPSRFILGLPPITNVVTSATGTTATAAQINTVLSLINTSNYSGSFNSIGGYTSSNITVKNNLNLSNASILANGAKLLTSNTLNGSQYVAIQTNAVEAARYTPTGLGLGLTAPIARLDVNGSEVIRGSLYISTMGAVVTSTLGNLYADGNLFANGILYPSDPGLKRDFKPYVSNNLPEAIEFIWRSSGQRDIGVNASELETIEPACVQRTPAGTLVVDYPKLTVLCLAEIRTLKGQVAELQSTVMGMRAE